MSDGCLGPSVAETQVRRTITGWRWLWTALLTMGFAARLVAGQPATAVATVAAGFVTGIAVTVGGSGYEAAPAVTISGGGGSGATGKAVLAGDAVSLVIVLTAGSGYTSPPTVTIEAPTKLKESGLRVRLVPALTVDGAAGSTNRLEWSLAVTGPWTVWTNVVMGADAVTLVDLGASLRFYRTSKVQPSDPTGVGVVAGEPAKAVATVTDGYVRGITVTAGGSGYVTAPAVTLSGGGGHGATGIAVLADGAVSLVIVLTAGDGYTSSPTVTIEEPPKQPEPPKESKLNIRLVSALTVDGPAGSTNRLECSLEANGPWSVWTNVVMGTAEVTLVDWAVGASLRFYRTSEAQLSAPPGMALIPSGTFTMGDTLDGDANAKPITVSLSAFYMDTNLVSYGVWKSVHAYATSHGYDISPGAGKANGHPVYNVNWYDTVKWCNARSQQAGMTVVYYTDAALTQVYTSGEPGTVYANWDAGGYRLPTEAEWEYAARGGLVGQRFPWGMTISESQANYVSTGSYSYDLGPNGYTSQFATGDHPYTSPVGSFAPNGYGLYDMAGNVWQWCWDWYGTYSGGINPRGAVSGSLRVLRGGSWYGNAFDCRSADRCYYDPSYDPSYGGFRAVLSPGQ